MSSFTDSQWPLISQILGWSYTIAWSVSFYPQVVLNWRRKSVEGLSLDFVYLNLWGFACYTIFNVTLYAFPEAKRQYRDRWGSDGLIRLNDVVFSAHALLLCAITAFQTWTYPRGRNQITASWLWQFIALTSYGALILGLDTRFGGADLLDLLYYISFIKMAVSLIKYIPQAVLNTRRQSTVGWSIGNILLDFTGGFLSLGQILIDASLTGDWSAVTGNPVKFGLGILSISFDVLFIFQHYVLYRNKGDEDDRRPLIPDEEETSPV